MRPSMRPPQLSVYIQVRHWIDGNICQILSVSSCRRICKFKNERRLSWARYASTTLHTWWLQRFICICGWETSKGKHTALHSYGTRSPTLSPWPGALVGEYDICWGEPALCFGNNPTSSWPLAHDATLGILYDIGCQLREVGFVKWLGSLCHFHNLHFPHIWTPMAMSNSLSPMQTWRLWADGW